MTSCCGGIGFVGLGHDPPCAFEISLAGIGRSDETRRAHEQLHAEPALERGDGSRHHGWRQREAPRRRRERLLLGDSDEHGHCV